MKKNILCAAAFFLSLTLLLPLFGGCRPAEPTGADPVSETVADSGTDPVLTDGETETEEVTEEETTAPEEEKRISFVCAGDNVIHPGIYLDAAERAQQSGSSKEYDFLPMYEEVADLIRGADVSFINQETLMCGAAFGYSGYPQFNSPQQLGNDLCELGFDVVAIANNHMCDKGADGLAGTISFWKSLSDRTLMIGGYENEADYNTVRLIERDGVKIAFLAYTYGTNGLTLYNTDIVVPYLNEEDILRQTTMAKEQADMVIVSMHWGDDSVQAVTEKQRYYAQLLADCGVDVIIGHHPHLIQPIEWFEGRTGNRTLCIFSLGNLLSEMAEAHNMVGGFLTFDAVYAGKKTRIENVVFLPTVFFFNSRYHGTHVYFMENFSEELAGKHGVAWCYQNPISYEEMKSYTRSIIGREFLPDWINE